MRRTLVVKGLTLHFNDFNIYETVIKISKASYINVCQTQSEVYNSLYLPRVTSENIFKVESLAHLKVGGGGGGNVIS